MKSVEEKIQEQTQERQKAIVKRALKLIKEEEARERKENEN
jgi:hypothetical protein